MMSNTYNIMALAHESASDSSLPSGLGCPGVHRSALAIRVISAESTRPTTLPRPTDTPRAITPLPLLHGYHACVYIPAITP